MASLAEKMASAKKLAGSISKKIKDTQTKSAAGIKLVNKNISSSIQKGKQVKDKYKSIIAQNDFLVFYLTKRSDNKEFVELGKTNAEESAKKLLEGLGGAKNIIKVKRTIYTVTVFFRSHYRLNKELLAECGGLGLWIGDHQLTLVFDWTETKHIATYLNNHAVEAKVDFIPLDID
ncbi:hypothetical protein MHSWG343_01490 [Candidatus Mycoplasma haematohominis]|uniref:Uncharacterized protein n=1 Tax=Candidatus Mycoplasma haematohominis TaxID=1494318 RepID=A0A478FPA8_9MOLU|nr:hypothetical protein MHSWG343_01490 [Candidatus Mycoplasma haemohominis]